MRTRVKIPRPYVKNRHSGMSTIPVVSIAGRDRQRNVWGWGKCSKIRGFGSLDNQKSK